MSKKPKVREHTISGGCYHIPITVFIGNNYDIAKKAAEKKMRCSLNMPDVAWDGAPGAATFFSGTHVAMWFPKIDNTANCVNTVAHECSHAAFKILNRWAGIQHCVETDEAYAMLVGYLAGEVMKLK
jgi:hypothetical protein